MPVLIALNDRVDSYKTTGLGVGLEKGTIFASTLIEKEIDLLPGQVFAFISDGITEAMNEENELFGEDRLTEILKNKSDASSNGTMNELWNSVKIFRGSAEQNDDMTAVIIRIKR